MKSPDKSGAGFTIIEILIVIGLLTGIFAMGVVTGTDTYQRYIFRAELEKTAALLQKARSSAMANVGESSHGVYFDNVSSNIILFRGTSYATSSPYNLKVEKSKVVSISGPSAVIFTPLSGTSTAGIITLSDGIRNSLITVNNEGQINW